MNLVFRIGNWAEDKNFAVFILYLNHEISQGKVINLWKLKAAAWDIGLTPTL